MRRGTNGDVGASLSLGGGGAGRGAQKGGGRGSETGTPLRPSRPNSGLGASGDKKTKGNGKGSGSKSPADHLPWRRSTSGEEPTSLPSDQPSAGVGGGIAELATRSTTPEAATPGEDTGVRAKDEVNAEIRNLCEGGCALQPGDFDARIRQHFHALLGAGGRQRLHDACAMIRAASVKKERSAVRNWPAYLLTLLRKFDEEVGWKDREARARARVQAAAEKKSKEAKEAEEEAEGAEEGTTRPFASRRGAAKAEPPAPAWWEATGDEVFPGEEPAATPKPDLPRFGDEQEARSLTPETPEKPSRPPRAWPQPMEQPPVPPPPSPTTLAALAAALPATTTSRSTPRDQPPVPPPTHRPPPRDQPPVPPPAHRPEPQDCGRTPLRVPVAPPPSTPPCVPRPLTSAPPNAPPTLPGPMRTLPSPPGNLIRPPGNLMGDGVLAGRPPMGPPHGNAMLHPPPRVAAPGLGKFHPLPSKLPPGIMAPAARPHGPAPPAVAGHQQHPAAGGGPPGALNFPLEAWAAWLGQPAVRPIAAR
jgi:hypothetical protein